MQRLPKAFISNKLASTTAADTEYTVPSNSIATFSACTLNNTTGDARTVTVNVIPSGDTADAANQIATSISVPASGSTPVNLSAVIGHHLEAGGKINFAADTATAVAVFLSGYLTTA